MSDFLTLFKYDFKLQFPFKGKKEKRDFVGGFSSFLITALIVAVFVYLFATIANNYVLVEINKVKDPQSRALELMNVFYVAIIAIMSLTGVEQMRKSLTFFQKAIYKLHLLWYNIPCITAARLHEAIRHARKTPMETTQSVNFTLSVAWQSVFCKKSIFSKGEYENDSSRKAGNY